MRGAGCRQANRMQVVHRLVVPGYRSSLRRGMLLAVAAARSMVWPMAPVQ